MKRAFLGLSLSIAGLVACGSSVPTPELVTARQAYDRARIGPAATFAPDSLLDAKNALDQAESVHGDDPQSDRERSYAYVAERRAQVAELKGSTAQAKQTEKQATQQYSDLQDKLRTSAESKLDATQNRVRDLREQTVATSRELEAERTARKDAEARAQRALQSLEKIAQIKEEARGTVITLSGQVLFVTAKSELLPSARDQLTQVAKALIDAGDDKPIVVEGYTDSRGSDDMNLKLSQDRAEAVRAYLISMKVPAQRITANGKGKSNPVASNDTPEGRANNRRVEIIVGNAAAARATTGANP